MDRGAFGGSASMHYVHVEIRGTDRFLPALTGTWSVRVGDKYSTAGGYTVWLNGTSGTKGDGDFEVISLVIGWVAGKGLDTICRHLVAALRPYGLTLKAHGRVVPVEEDAVLAVLREAQGEADDPDQSNSGA